MVDLRNIAFLCAASFALAVDDVRAQEPHDHDHGDEHDHSDHHDHDDEHDHDGHDDDHDHGDHHDHDDHDHRAHDVHVHGTWELFAALDDARLSVTLKGPLIDVLGFESAPDTDAERKAVAELKDQLQSPEAMIALDARARCALTAPGTVVLPEDFSPEPEKNGTETPDGDSDGSHSHDHSHDHHDVEVTYLFDCNAPARLGELIVSGFEAFPAINTVDAVFLDDATSVAERLTRSSRSLSID